jgi:hypothetical protein
MPALQRLELSWPLAVDLLQQLPALGAFTGLTSLRLSSCRWHHKRMCGQRLGLQELLRVLQGCSRLEELKLRVAVNDPEVRAPCVSVQSAGECGNAGSSSSSSSSSSGRSDSGRSSRSDVGGTSHTTTTTTTTSSSSSSDSDSDHSSLDEDDGGSSDEESANYMSRERLVLCLQEALPSLRRLLHGEEGRVAPLAADTLAALPPGLQVGHAWTEL